MTLFTLYGLNGVDSFLNSW